MLPRSVAEIIISYNCFIDCINVDKLNWYGLCTNTAAINLIKTELEQNPNSTRINWSNICGNPASIELIKAELKQNPNSTKINWPCLNKNPAAMDLIKAEHKLNPKSWKIDWFSLCMNFKIFKSEEENTAIINILVC